MNDVTDDKGNLILQTFRRKCVLREYALHNFDDGEDTPRATKYLSDVIEIQLDTLYNSIAHTSLKPQGGGGFPRPPRTSMEIQPNEIAIINSLTHTDGIFEGGGGEIGVIRL